MWIGYLFYTLNLQEHFPAVQTFYPGRFRMLAAPIGMFLGTLMTPFFLDKYKLRHVLYFGAFIAILCCIVMPFAFAPEVIIVDRVAFGISIGLLLTKYCVFVSVAVPNQHILRYTSYLVSGFAFGCALASLVAYLSYDDKIFSRSFRIPFYIGIGLVLMWTGFVSLFLPEGPWYFLREGNDDAAARVLAAFHGLPINHQDVQAKIIESKLSQKNSNLKSHTLITPLNSKLRAKTMVSATLLFLTFASLPATCIFYGPRLLNIEFDGKTKIFISLIYTSVFFLFAVVNKLIINKLTRKNVMLLSAAILSAITLLLCFITIKDNLFLALAILCLSSFICAIWLSISLSTVMQIFGEEAKSRSIAFSLACAWLGAVVILLIDIYLPHLTVYIVLILSLVSLIWIKISPLPEQYEVSAYEQSRRELLRQDSVQSK